MESKHLAPGGIAGIATLMVCSACNRLDLIEYSPKVTPKVFLASQPHYQFTLLSNPVILTQPSSTLLVYAAGLLTLGVGLYFLRVRQQQKARLWWGVGLLVSGIGALLAGTSYQAFGYEIKCAGRSFCTWTSWWEVAYLLCTVAGINALLTGVACSCAQGRGRRAVSLFAVLSTVVYSMAVLCGAFIPVRFLVSFECLMLASTPAVVLALLLTLSAVRRQWDRPGLSLLTVWFVFLLVMVAYLLALELDSTAVLWRRGIWFTENDVLHAGMILWVLLIAVTLPKTIADR